MTIRNLSRHNTPISLVGLLILLTMTIGCGVLFHVNRVVKLHPVILTPEDLPTMQLTSSDSNRRPTTRGPTLESAVIVEFEQRWNENQLIVEYWLFDAAYTAKKAAETYRFRRVAGTSNHNLDRNPEEVIGDATWHLRPMRRWAPHWTTELYFVKNNVLVYITAKGHPSNQLRRVRDVARKIEAKINASSNQQ